METKPKGSYPRRLINTLVFCKSFGVSDIWTSVSLKHFLCFTFRTFIVCIVGHFETIRTRLFIFCLFCVFVAVKLIPHTRTCFFNHIKMFDLIVNIIFLLFVAFMLINLFNVIDKTFLRSLQLFPPPKKNRKILLQHTCYVIYVCISF